MQNSKSQTILTALALTLLLANGAMAQAAGGDVLGVSTVRDAAIVVFKVLAVLGIGFGFIRLMSGRHTMEGLVTMGVGALGVAKTDAIAGLMGL